MAMDGPPMPSVFPFANEHRDADPPAAAAAPVPVDRQIVFLPARRRSRSPPVTRPGLRIDEMMHWRNHKFGTMSRELCLKILSNFSLTWFDYVSHRLKYDTRTYVLRRVLYVARCVDQDCWTPHRNWYDLDLWCSQRYEHLGRPINHLQFRH